ncbi:glycosyltransferase [Vibrio sp. WXL103]|uniref:glycosyltransferase n=1 Tax=Vibrio sp. WXL103 TaxID=3450710 RepID=UPI003EC87365
MKITVVIVTHNKKDDLIKSIDALRNQSKAFDELIIIDNCSTDGTRELLLENGLVSEDLSLSKNVNANHFTLSVFYKNSGGNIGGAGGFNLGQTLAIDRGADYIWFMDDDAISEPNALELLFDAVECEGYDIVNPLVIDIKDNSKLSFGLSSKIMTVNEANEYKDDRGIIDGYINPFNGTFYSSNVISLIGKVKAEMFIWGDETEYILRAKDAGLNVATVVDAVVYHPASKTTTERFFFNLLEIECKPAKLMMNYYRNRAYIAISYGKRRRRPKKHKLFMKGILYFLCKREYKTTIDFIRYYVDGLTGKYELPPIRYE